MASGLDMTLDDLIKTNKKSSSAAPNRGRGRGSAAATASGPARRFPNRAATRSAPYSTGKAPESAWKHDMFVGQVGGLGAAGSSSIETGTKLYISNLDYGVSNEDIKELFAEVGDLKRASINYDRSGRSKGTAEIVFSRKQDALAAIKRYNNVQLDGKPMKIEMVGTNIATPTTVPLVSNFAFGNPNGVPNSGRGGGRGFTGRPRGGGRGRGGRGRGRGRGKDEPASAASLDADLDKYHAEAMQTN